MVAIVRMVVLVRAVVMRMAVQRQPPERIRHHLRVEVAALAGVDLDRRAPVARMRSASLLVCWSPSITASGSAGARRFRTSIVAHSSVVLPEPGLETRL